MEILEKFHIKISLRALILKIIDTFPLYFMGLKSVKQCLTF